MYCVSRPRFAAPSEVSSGADICSRCTIADLPVLGCSLSEETRCTAALGLVCPSLCKRQSPFSDGVVLEEASRAAALGLVPHLAEPRTPPAMMLLVELLPEVLQQVRVRLPETRDLGRNIQPQRQESEESPSSESLPPAVKDSVLLLREARHSKLRKIIAQEANGANKAFRCIWRLQDCPLQRRASRWSHHGRHQ
ncbi:hypothetical protein Efla_003057 [Eimeria flavescens]